MDELEGAGGERLKEALAALGLKCGGTPRQRAERLWITRVTPLHTLDKKLFAAGCVPPAPTGAVSGADGADTAVAVVGAGAVGGKRRAAARAAAVMEAQVGKMAETLVNVIADTKGRIEKRQAQTYEEMMVGWLLVQATLL